MLDRALSIFDTIIKGLIFRGHSIKCKDNQTYAIVDGEEIQIRLTERKKQNPNSSNRCDNNNNIFSGELQFYIYHSSSFHSPTLVHDTVYTKIEDKIISIVAYLEIEADNRKTERIEAEEREKRRKEEERKREEFEEEKRKELEDFKDPFDHYKRIFQGTQWSFLYISYIINDMENIAKKSNTEFILNTFNLKPSKKYGQNFLVVSRYYSKYHSIMLRWIRRQQLLK